VDPRIDRQLLWLERRSRMLTGTVLAVLALATAYGLLIFEGQLTRPSFHFYPWLMAVMFYAAGDLLAYIWFKVLTLKLAAMLMLVPKDGPEEKDDEFELEPAKPDVEVVRPGEGAE
jgi:hypothetical protein